MVFDRPRNSMQIKATCEQFGMVSGDVFLTCSDRDETTKGVGLLRYLGETAGVLKT